MQDHLAYQDRIRGYHQRLRQFFYGYLFTDTPYVKSAPRLSLGSEPSLGSHPPATGLCVGPGTTTMAVGNTGFRPGEQHEQ
jgi:hypothetical protein